MDLTSLSKVPLSFNGRAKEAYVSEDLPENFEDGGQLWIRITSFVLGDNGSLGLVYSKEVQRKLEVADVLAVDIVLLVDHSDEQSRTKLSLYMPAWKATGTIQEYLSEVTDGFWPLEPR